jgi:pantoate--beta-alanine ligase
MYNCTGHDKTARGYNSNMQVIETIAEMKQARKNLRGTLGFVPTMGYLHEGHLTLVRQALAENKFAAASIFVNPTQFGPKEDFKKYPRDPERDLAMLKGVGTHIVFMPTVEEMYPEGYNSWVDVEGVTDHLEGAHRPGHFRGVATVVTKLFNIVEPTKSYFGQKDAQQLLVIKKMVADLNMNTEVIAAATVREPDGLAMSSRNTYLNPKERQAGLVLWRALSLSREMYLKGERNADKLRQAMIQLISREPLATIDYVSVANTKTLVEFSQIEGPALVSMAVRIGNTRLIDNIILGS